MVECDGCYDEHCVKQACIMETLVHIVTTVTGFTSTIGMSFCGLLKTSIEKDVSRDRF